MVQRREQGFTLIEVIVALVIIASGVAVLVRGFGQSWHTQLAGTRAAQALAIAEARLVALGSLTPLADGQTFSGTDSGISWRARVERHVPAISTVEEAQASAAPKAYWLILDAEWQDTAARPPHALRLRTLKFGTSP